MSSDMTVLDADRLGLRLEFNILEGRNVRAVADFMKSTTTHRLYGRLLYLLFSRLCDREYLGSITNVPGVQILAVHTIPRWAAKCTSNEGHFVLNCRRIGKNRKFQIRERR